MYEKVCSLSIILPGLPGGWTDQGSYIGETGCTLYERSSEHRMDAEKKKDSSHIWKHWALSHPDMVTQPPFTFKVLKVHRSALERQLHEAIKISTDGVLNDRCEFCQNLVKRLSVNFTERELREQDKLADRLDREAAAADTELSRKLESNKHITSSNLICTANPLSDLNTMLDSNLFSDTATKRPYFETDLSPNKRLKLEIETDLIDLKMGRKSNGHSHYEFKNSIKGAGNPAKISASSSAPPVETLRSTPGFVMKTPSTFAEAASLARLKTLERKFPSSSPMDPNLQGLQPREIFGKLPATLSSLSSNSHSSTDSLGVISDEEWGNVGSQEEGELSRAVLSLTIDDMKQEIAPSDSFSSDPETEQNKGAVAFLRLLEDTLARQDMVERGKLFESLIVQMVDISLDNKVHTPNDIADTLAQKGWNLGQVAGVWSVPAGDNHDSCWTVSAIDKLGGKGTTARVWNELKEAKKTGFPKRPACTESLEPRKRPRVELPSNKVSNSQRACKAASSKMDSLADRAAHNVSEVSCSQMNASRKILRAGRKCRSLDRSKITWWLSQADDISPENPATPVPNSPEIIQPTPTSKPKQRRRYRKKKDASQDCHSLTGSPLLAAAGSSKKTKKTSTAHPTQTPAHPTPPTSIESGEHLYRSRKKSSSISPRKKAPSRAVSSKPRAQSPSPTPFPARISRKIFEEDRTSSEAKMTSDHLQDVASGAAPTDRFMTGNGSLDGNLP